jgi:hypothetical protein
VCTFATAAASASEIRVRAGNSSLLARPDPVDLAHGKLTAQTKESCSLTHLAVDLATDSTRSRIVEYLVHYPRDTELQSNSAHIAGHADKPRISFCVRSSKTQNPGRRANVSDDDCIRMAVHDIGRKRLENLEHYVQGNRHLSLL